MSSTQAISMVVGLGNPGDKYTKTRHNAGFWFLDALAKRDNATFKLESKFHGWVATVSLNGYDVRLLKPTTFMNHSGRSISALAKFYKIPRDKILIAHDELDLPAGTTRLKQGGGHGGHNGLRDAISALGGKDFWRLRIGIDHPGDRNEVVNYVLKAPSKTDMQQIERSMDDAERVMDLFLTGDAQKAMMQLHSA